jgi:hypothetical protein
MVARSLARLAAPRAVVPDIALRRVRASIDEFRAMTHPALVPCHGDFGGHNLLRAGEPGSVIDLARAAWNPPAVDFARLYLGPLWERPDLADAFFEGYGRPVTEEELEAVRLLLPTLALNVLSLGVKRGNAAMVERGRRRLERQLAGHAFTRRAPLLRRAARLARSRIRSPRVADSGVTSAGR